MIPKIDQWIHYLCRPGSHHNLCISYPLQLKATAHQYAPINELLQQEILGQLKICNAQPNTSFVHSDVLILEELNVKSTEELEAFSQTRAYFLPSKFVLILGPQKLSTVVSNKILKILEDPPIALSFILLGFNTTELIPTIRSRFLNWRLAMQDLPSHLTALAQPAELLLELKQCTNPKELEAWADKWELEETQCLHYFWELMLPQIKTSQEAQRYLSFQQWYDQSYAWKNSPQERWYFLFQLMKNQLQSIPIAAITG